MIPQYFEVAAFSATIVGLPAFTYTFTTIEKLTQKLPDNRRDAQRHPLKTATALCGIGQYLFFKDRIEPADVPCIWCRWSRIAFWSTICATTPNSAKIHLKARRRANRLYHELTFRMYNLCIIDDHPMCLLKLDKLL